MVPVYLIFYVGLIVFGIVLVLEALERAVASVRGTRKEVQPKHIFMLIFFGVVSIVFGLSPWMF